MDNVVYKKCECRHGCEKTVIVSENYSIKSKILKKCGKCQSVIFPNKLSQGVMSFADGNKTSVFEIFDYKHGRCFFYEEENQV